MHSNVPSTSSTICPSASSRFTLTISTLVILLTVASVTEGTRLCGRPLMHRIYKICDATSTLRCAELDEEETITPRDGKDLSQICCSKGCETSRIERYCCIYQATKGTPFRPEVKPHSKHHHRMRNIQPVDFKNTAYDLV